MHSYQKMGHVSADDLREGDAESDVVSMCQTMAGSIPTCPTYSSFSLLLFRSLEKPMTVPHRKMPVPDERIPASQSSFRFQSFWFDVSS